MKRNRTKGFPAGRRYRRGFFYALLALPLAYLAWQTAGHTQEAAVMVPPPAVDSPLAASSGEATAVLSGGCFWGMQGVFEHVKGVKQVLSGYSGGTVKDPSYEMVS